MFWEPPTTPIGCEPQVSLSEDGHGVPDPVMFGYFTHLFVQFVVHRSVFAHFFRSPKLRPYLPQGTTKLRGMKKGIQLSHYIIISYDKL